MTTDIKRFSKGQPGNQNVRQHGYYYSAFAAVNQADLIRSQPGFRFGL